MQQQRRTRGQQWLLNLFGVGAVLAVWYWLALPVLERCGVVDRWVRLWPVPMAALAIGLVQLGRLEHQLEERERP